MSRLMLCSTCGEHLQVDVERGCLLEAIDSGGLHRDREAVPVGRVLEDPGECGPWADRGK